MDGNIAHLPYLFLLIVKIRPLMDGNHGDGFIEVPESEVKIRPLMDGNLCYCYNILCLNVKIRPLMDGNIMYKLIKDINALKSDH